MFNDRYCWVERVNLAWKKHAPPEMHGGLRSQCRRFCLFWSQFRRINKTYNKVDLIWVPIYFSTFTELSVYHCCCSERARFVKRTTLWFCAIACPLLRITTMQCVDGWTINISNFFMCLLFACGFPGIKTFLFGCGFQILKNRNHLLYCRKLKAECKH